MVTDETRPATDPEDLRAERRLRVWFGVVVLAALAPALTLSPFPSQDGPSHAYAARAIAGVLSGESPFVAAYDVDLSPDTNWLGGLIFYGLGQVVSLEQAERILISLFVVVFSLGWWRLARVPSGVVRSPIVLVGPFFATGMTLHLGFYSYGVGLSLLPWVWALAAGSARSLVIAGVLATVAWFGHVLPAAFAALGLAIIGASTQASTPPRRRVIEAALSALPSAALVLYWLVSRPPSAVANTHQDTLTLLEAAFTLRPLSAWIGTTEHIAMGLALVFAVFVASGQLASRRPCLDPPERRVRLWPWWLLSGGTFAAYLILPEGGQGFWFVSERLGLYPWLALLPVAANVNPRRHLRSAILAKGLTRSVIAACLLFGLSCWLEAKGLQEDQERAVNNMKRASDHGGTAILLDFSTQETARFRPYLHLLGRAAAKAGVIDASTHEPHTDHFQLRLKPHHGFPSPERLMGDPASLTRYDLRNVCTLVSVAAPTAWVTRIEEEGWQELPWARSEESRTLIHRKGDAFCASPAPVR